MFMKGLEILFGDFKYRKNLYFVTSTFFVSYYIGLRGYSICVSLGQLCSSWIV